MIWKGHEDSFLHGFLWFTISATAEHIVLVLNNLSQQVGNNILFCFCSMYSTMCIRKGSKISHSYDYWLLWITVYQVLRYLIEFFQPKTCLGPVCQCGAESCKHLPTWTSIFPTHTMSYRNGNEYDCGVVLIGRAHMA